MNHQIQYKGFSKQKASFAVREGTISFRKFFIYSNDWNADDADDADDTDQADKHGFIFCSKKLQIN